MIVGYAKVSDSNLVSKFDPKKIKKSCTVKIRATVSMVGDIESVLPQGEEQRRQ